MRLATIVDGGGPRVGLVREGRVLPLPPAETGFDAMRAIAAAGDDGLRRIAQWAESQPASAFRPLDEFEIGPVVPDPGAIYTIGHNYGAPGEREGSGPERPLVYGKAAASVAAHGARLSWDRSLTDNVDAECELGVVMGAQQRVFGYTIINDISSRDAWLDGDQWLLGKSMPGFCPAGPWLVTADELSPASLALGCRINGAAIQEGRTASMRFSIAEVIGYLARHLELRPGDLIATGTPARLEAPPGPARRLRAGDRVTAWIEGIGELETYIA